MDYKSVFKWLLAAIVCFVIFQNCSGRFTAEDVEGQLTGSLAGPDNASMTPITIGYYGDSTIQGDTRNGAKPAPQVFDENLPEIYVTLNEGVSGASILELLEGRDYVHPAWETEIAKSPAKYIILNYALNDTNETGNTPEKFKATYSKVVDIARAHGKFVILETPNPTNYSQYLKPWVEAIRQLAVEKNCPLIDQFSYLNDYMTANRLTINDITYDGVHPTQEGYILKGRYAAKQFLEIVKLVPFPEQSSERVVQ